MSTRSRNLWRGRRWRESAWTRARAIASLGMVFGLGAVGTMAYWVDNSTVTTGTFSVASLDLQVNDSKAFTSWTLSGTGLMPGETKAATLTVQNKGGINFNYTAKVDASGSATLAPYLTLTLKSDATLNATTGTCDSGDQIGSSTLQLGTPKDLVTEYRHLSSGGAETLCAQIEVSNAVTKAASNSSVKASVVFTATEPS